VTNKDDGHMDMKLEAFYSAIIWCIRMTSWVVIDHIASIWTEPMPFSNGGTIRFRDNSLQ